MLAEAFQAPLDLSISISPFVLACPCMPLAAGILICYYSGKISSNDDLKNLYTEKQFLLQKFLAKDAVDRLSNDKVGIRYSSLNIKIDRPAPSHFAVKLRKSIAYFALDMLDRL